MTTLGAIALVITVPASCQTRPEEAASWFTQDQIFYIRVAIAAFDSAHGRLPEQLREICEPGSACPWMLPGDNLDGLKDGWGVPFVYERVHEEYELRSAGPDMHPHTADDVVFRPSIEHARMMQAAGCYEANFDWWEEYSGGHLILDTTAIAPGAFVLRPAQRSHYSMASWQVGATRL